MNVIIAGDKDDRNYLAKLVKNFQTNKSVAYEIKNEYQNNIEIYISCTKQIT